MAAPGAGPAPLLHDRSLRLPERTRFVAGLSKLEGRLHKSALAGYGSIFERSFIVVVRGRRQGRGYIGRKEALDELKAEVNELRAALRGYLAARIDPSVSDQVFRPIPLTGPPQARPAAIAVRTALLSQPTLLTSVSQMLSAGGLHFSVLFRSRLFGKEAVEIDRLESSLTPEVAESAFASELLMAEARERYELWFGVVRLSLAATIARSLPYEAIWRGVYGTAGYWLSLQVEKLAAEITASRAYRDLVATSSADSWIREYISLGAGDAGGAVFQLGRTLDSLGRDAEAWRNSCRLRPCSPASQGTESPVDFDPIAPALHANPALSGTLPDHMFARGKAQQRAARVARHWDWLRKQVLNLPAGALRFRINAGSLEHGGAHPPHSTHRNGAMFDLGLGKQGELPVPTCPAPVEITVSEPVIRLESARDNPSTFSSVGTIIDTLRNMFGLLDEPDDTDRAGPAEGKKYTFCARDLEFPAGGVKTEAGVEVSYDDIALRFTQAMLLTFPSQILYARWATLRGAQSDLIDRIAAAESRLTKDGRRMSDDEDTALTYFKSTLGRRPPAQLPSSGSFGVLFQRDDHADHWHLSYRPEDIDGSNSNRDTALQWLEQNRRLLWP